MQYILHSSGVIAIVFIFLIPCYVDRSLTKTNCKSKRKPMDTGINGKYVNVGTAQACFAGLKAMD